LRLLATAPEPRAAKIWPLALGALFAAIGFWALSTIHGANEFRYAGVWPLAEPLPFAAMSGFTPWQLSSHLARLLWLTPAVLFAAMTLARAHGRLGRVPLWAIAAGSVAVMLGIALLLHGTPLHDDDATYLMQAAPLSQGHLFAPPVPRNAWWGEPFTVFTRGATTGKYLFGEPLLLAPGLLLGFPLLGPLLAAFFTVLAMHRQSRAHVEEPVALLATALFAFSPALLFTSSTALSEVPALLGVALAVLGLSRAPTWGGALSGIGLGLALVTRPQVAVPAGVAILLAGPREPRRLLGMALGAVPFVESVFIYDRILTGHALTLPWFLSGGETMGFGHPTRTAYTFTPWKAAGQVLVALVRLNGWGLGWPVSLAGPVAWFALGRPRWEWLRPWAWVAALTFAFQFFYYTIGPSETGPLYHYPAVPFVALSTAAAVEALWRTRWAAVTTGLLLASAAIGTGSFLVEHALRLNRLARAIRAPYEGLAIQTPALLVVDLSPHYPVNGWVFGVLERTRRDRDPRVDYPYDSPEQLAYLRSRWPMRRCYFLTLEAGGSRHVGSCDGAQGMHEQWIARENRPFGWVDAVDERRPAVRWQEAFGWLGLR
jgi:hypothetical protein